MCGIAGVYNTSGKPCTLSQIKRMTQSIAHRGPDGEGYYVKDHIALGHKRLAILDVSEKGAQPMISEDGDWIISFNGCIYNFLELKQELRAKGHRFNSQCDTEVIVEGLAAYGPAFMERLNGMFAIAAWHKSEQTLYLFRDRFGVKPLYYWQSRGKIVFASEIKAIIAHPDYKVSVNMSALNEYFTFQNLFRTHTLFEGVNMLPPATTLKIDRTGIATQTTWWDYDFTEPDEKMTFMESKEETLRLFTNSVARQMISDVPVGSYLSGGMDSGSVTALASRHVRRMTTFTCGFDMSEVTGVESNYDERRDAELMANYFKTEHYEQVINAGDLHWSLPRVVNHIEDLRVGMSYPNYYIARLASKFVKVCLQGTGGDELYGGYPWRYYRVFDSIDQGAFFDQYYDFWQRLVPDSDKPQLFHKQVLQQVDLQEPRRVFEDVFRYNSNLQYDTPEQHIQNSLYFEIKTFMPGLLLVGDKLAMANGLEERFPFLDNDLVAFAQKVPVRHKLGDLETMKQMNENTLGNKKQAYRQFYKGKSVLRKAMAELIPEKIINRKKQGFSAPDESWYRGENARYIRELLLTKKTASSEFINPKYIARVVDEHMHKKVNNRLLIWSLMNFEWWCRIFLQGEKIE